MLRAFARQLRSSDFLRQNAILFVGSLAVSVLNYAYYPVLGRLLKVEEFGEVQVLISLFLQLSLFLAVLGQVTVNVIANYKDERAKREIIFELEKLGLFLSAIVFVIGAVFSWQLRNILHFESAWPFIMLLLTLIATVPLSFRGAYLRGNKRFSDFSVAGIIGAVGKLAISVLLVLVGFSTVGAIGGVLAAQLLAFGYAVSRARRAGFERPAGASYFSLPKIKRVMPELMYSLFVLIASLGVAVLSSVDVLIVKHFFDAQTAGAYAGISTVAKILFFLTASVAQVMLPSVKIDAEPGENKRYLLKSLGLVGLLGGGALALFTLLPGFVVTTLMGAHYVTYVHLLPLLSFAMFVISLLNLLVFYYVALRQYQVAVIVILGLVLTCLLVVAGRASLDGVVDNLTLGSVAMLAMFGVWQVAARLRAKEVTA
jgi:O-antigen/teichoic acid export membrane protein